ncbi:MAG TPA: SAM-dependent methyltransferase [Clostridiales bacterium]|nr:SAM-dependent methyltransferase [Clostridiales bacterium]
MKGAALSDPRLQMLANKIPKGAVVADIGTDHGYLVCYLAEMGICSYAYACDIGEKPLENARREIQSRGLETKVETRLTDGLQGLPLDSITHIVIAGMGGELIASILEACPEARSNRLRFLLQPMTKAERLRKWLCQNGFEIVAEDGVESGKFLYTVMEVIYTGKVWEPKPLYFWTGKLPQSNCPASKTLLGRVAARLRRAGEGLSASQKENELGKEYLALAAEIEGIIKGEEP